MLVVSARWRLPAPVFLVTGGAPTAERAPGAPPRHIREVGAVSFGRITAS